MIEDKNNSDKFIRRLRELKDKAVDIGIMGDANRDYSDRDIVLIAAVHEFGSPKRRIPERSFLRSNFDDNYDRYADMLMNRIEDVLDGAISVNDALSLVGQTVAQDTQMTIRRVIPPPLKEATIKRKGKGKTTPLIDTGRLIGSITYEVKDV
ncbi:MAG: hypothetical protein SOZ40_06020 [Ezakiella sp.]|nr:hypothetical protein [Ezakiella sp.]